MWLIFNIAYLAAGLLALPLLAYQRLIKGKRRTGWRQRFGHLPPRDHARACVWIHAVSLGETNATRGIVDGIRKAMPDRDIAISTTTDTGFTRARELYPDLYVFRYPLDFSWVVRRALRIVNPAVIVLMELEVWPNLVLLASAQGIPVTVANGRITEERSMRRFRLPVIRPFAAMMFSRLAWVGAQNEEYAGRFRELGVPADRVHITGMLKWDTAQIADDLPGTEALCRATGIDRRRPLWVCGQTGPGEEIILLEAYRTLRNHFPDLQMAMIPRKPERFQEVADLIAQSGCRFVRRSRCPDGSAPPSTPPDIILGDTMGELRKFYCPARVVFVGRSLVPMGGSDIIEVAALAKPIIIGPYTENFADSVAELSAAGAVYILRVTPDDRPQGIAERLADVVRTMLAGDEASRMGTAGRRVVQKNQGVTQRTVTALIDLTSHAQHRTT